MYSFALLDLRWQTSWDPMQLTRQSFRWPTQFPEVQIKHLAKRLVPASLAEVGAPVITPASIDVKTGAVRRRARNYQGAVFQVGVELHRGDILIARSGKVPVLLVDEYLRGSLVSERFVALRTESLELSRWIWAVLNSESGIHLRTHLMSSSETPVIAPASLLRATVPVPPMNQLVSIAKIVGVIQEGTRSSSAESSETWWSTADLRTFEWRLALATPDPGRLATGVPFGELCAEIVRGKNTRNDAIDYEAFGFIPVADVSTLGGKAPRRWVPWSGEHQVIAGPGELLVAAVGDYSYATAPSGPVGVDRNVYRVRLHDPSLMSALVAYLNSADGFGMRRILLTGITVPSLSRADIARIPIPRHALTGGVDVGEINLPPLAQRLEQALWQN